MYRVEFKENIENPYENKGLRYKETTEVYLFNTKSAAFDFFMESIAEHYRGKDFWASVDWNDIVVSSFHFDEEGSNTLTLYKWENFDKDVEFAWEYKGTKYHTLEELWENEPQFEGETMETDKPLIRSKENIDDFAMLDIKQFID